VSSVAVKEIDARQRINDANYLAVMFESQALVVNAVKGSTQLVPLLIPPDEQKLTGDARRQAIIESARREAMFSNIPVVYLLRYDIPPGPASLIVPP
jgi:hypothetical protein